MDILNRNRIVAAAALVLASVAHGTAAEERAGPLPEDWDYVAPMRAVAAKFRGAEGVVLHVGGSMTIASPFGDWARSGKGRTAEDVAVLAWMHAGAKDKTDGWWLCRTEIEHYRAHTAESGLQSPMLFAGGKRGLPTLGKMLDDHRPRIVTLEVGIYDAEEKRPVEEYRRNMARALDLILAAGIIPVPTTVPPFKADLERTRSYNEALRSLAKERGLPLLDLEREILTRRPDDWYGTLMKRIHLTASEAGGSATAEPTPENLRKSGYLLRGWLTVRKIAEMKRRVLDGGRVPEASAAPVAAPAPASAPAPAAAPAEPVRPTETIRLFNGKDLTGLTTWLADTKGDDPRKVFRVTDGMLHVSGDGFGYAATDNAYRDYRLVVEFKWGKKTDGGKYVRNSGVLLHATGPDGGAGKGAWMSCIECQLAQGCVGDLIVIRGKDEKGAVIPVQLTAETELAPDGKRRRWKAGGEAKTYPATRGQLWWSRHDWDFAELLDTHGREDVESPNGEWTRVECVSEGKTLTISVNGTVVNRCTDVFPAGGRILLQSEGFEVYFRTFELHPLKK